MRITQHTDYALRVLMYVGSNAARLVTIAEIAERFGISRAHLMKVVNRLVRAGFLEGRRGKGGGLRLAQAPAGIRIGDVFRAMEVDLRLIGSAGHGADRLIASTGHDADGLIGPTGHEAEPVIEHTFPGEHLCGREPGLSRALDEALGAFMAVLDRSTLADLLDEPLRQRLVIMMRAQ